MILGEIDLKESEMTRPAPAPRRPVPEEKEFALLAENLPEPAWIADPDGWIYWYNNRWYEYTGTTPDQMEGWGWQAVHDPNLLPDVLFRWKHSIATGQPFEMVFPLRGVDGAYRPFLTRVRPVRDAAGAITHWVGCNADVSQQEQQRLLLATLNETASVVAAELDLERLVQAVYGCRGSPDWRGVRRLLLQRHR